MIIDCHTHLGRNEHIKATADELLRSMDKAGIDKSLVFAGKMNDCPNEWMLEQIAPHKDRLFGVAAAKPWDHPYRTPDRFDAINKLRDWYGEGKIVAVKFYVGYEHYMPADEVAQDHLWTLNDINCPAIFHCGDCLNSVRRAKLKYAHPLNVDEVAVDYPNMNFIIAHMGYPWVKDTAEVCYKNSNVYTDISGFVYGNFGHDDYIKFKKMINEFTDISGNDKLLFGTDSPISNQESYVKTLKQLAADGPYAFIFPKELTKNTQKVFKLK